MPFFLLFSAAGLFSVIFPRLSWKLSSKRARFREPTDGILLAVRISGIAMIIAGLILTYISYTI